MEYVDGRVNDDYVTITVSNSDNDTTSSKTKKLLTASVAGEPTWDTRDTRAIAIPSLADYRKSDLEYYDTSTALYAVFDGGDSVHKAGVPAPTDISVSYNDATFDYAGYKCSWGRHQEQRCEHDNGAKSCVEVEVIRATQKWLIGVNIVFDVEVDGDGDGDGDASVRAGKSSCSNEWLTNGETWTKTLNSATTSDKTNENAAKALCASTAPLSDRELAVTIRNKHDPYLEAGAQTDCSYDFGPTAADHFNIATICFWIGGILFSPGFVFIVFYCATKERGEKKEPVLPKEEFHGAVQMT
jgi:hypothetical protein